MLRSHQVGLAGVMLLLAGCSADNLYIAHKANLGLNGGYNQAKPSGRFVLGYKEQFITVIPKSVPLTDEANNELGTKDEKLREAMAVLSCSDVKVGFLELKEYTEYLATGIAARLHARALVNGGPDDLSAARLLAFDLQDKLGAAAKALDDAVAVGGATAPPADLKTKVKAAQDKLTAVITGPSEQLASSLALLEVAELKTATNGLMESVNPAVKLSGQDLAAAQLSLPVNTTGQLESDIFNCFKKSQKT